MPRPLPAPEEPPAPVQLTHQDVKEIHLHRNPNGTWRGTARIHKGRLAGGVFEPGSRDSGYIDYEFDGVSIQNLEDAAFLIRDEQEAGRGQPPNADTRIL